ncbi:hypothetical protein B0H16DRAFT_1747997 [Mycena metata]|uniref:Uncharacterized protein n=1 Tax=Mycena metata TaxID=1033252 RepID=A0AAD7DYS6_9AGAR|nr:hypothetical protein B0H16DRAFT_1747997 [Mycena metata]
MPRKKKSNTANLGAWAQKRKRESEEDESNSDTGTKRTRLTSAGSQSSRNSSPAPESVADSDAELHPTNSALDSDFSDDDDPEIEVHEENDIPHPRTQMDLVRWLQISDTHLASLPISAAPAQRGQYHSRKVGQGKSIQREQELRKAEKERKEREDRDDQRHNRKARHIVDFFGRAQLPELPDPSEKNTSLDLASPGDNSVFDRDFVDAVDMDLDEEMGSPAEELDIQGPFSRGVSDTGSGNSLTTPGSSSKVTMEEIDEEEDEGDRISIVPIVLSPDALAEEGLDDLPWDPSEETSPRPAAATAGISPHHATTEVPYLPSRPSSPARRPLPPGSAAYFAHERGFTMPDRPQKWKLPSQVPSNPSVDTGIQNLQDILHPHRAKGRGHKQSSLDIVTTARLECVIRFLRLWCNVFSKLDELTPKNPGIHLVPSFLRVC